MIDPVQHHKQVRYLSRAEVLCPGCGRRTRDREGVCSSCRRATLPKLERLTVTQLGQLQVAIKAELKRRQDEIQKLAGEDE